MCPKCWVDVMQVKVVEEDVPLYFDYLWVPGVTNENWLPCFLGAPVGAPKETVSERKHLPTPM